jgi:tetratricopeptide (TPR) repeat protein
MRLEASLAALPADDPHLLARLAIRVAWLAWNCGQRTRAFEAATQAVVFARTCGDAPTLATALKEVCFCAAALRKFDEAEAALREADSIPGMPAAVRQTLVEARAVLSLQQGDPAAAARAQEQIRKERRALGNVGNELLVTLNLADGEHALGQTQRAVELVREVLPALRARKNRNALIQGLTNLAGYLVALHDLPSACAMAREAIAELAPREPESALVAIPIEHLALALARAGDSSRAAALAGYADAALRRAGFEREFTEQTTHGDLTALLRERLAPDDLARQLAEGAALTPQAAVALALEEP